MFFRAIKKYGWKNFNHEIIASNLSQEQANNLEKEMIAKFNTINPEFGYNIEPGGKRPRGLQSPMRRICKNTRGKKMSADVKDKLRQKQLENHQSGEIYTQEVNQKISCTVRDKWSDGVYANLIKPVYCIETDKIYNSAKEAALEIFHTHKDSSRECIRRCCTGEQKKHKNYHFQYISLSEEVCL